MEETNQYVVILPETLPLDGRERDLHAAYSAIPKRGGTYAASERKAVINILYRGLKGRTRLILGKLRDRLGAGNAWLAKRAEVYEVPEVVDEGSLVLSDPENEPYYQACFLADAMAKRRGVEPNDCFNEAEWCIKNFVVQERQPEQGILPGLS